MHLLDRVLLDLVHVCKEVNLEQDSVFHASQNILIEPLELRFLVR